MQTSLDLRKNFCYGTGSLVSVFIPSKSFWNLLQLMNFLVFVMKYHLSSHPSSSPLQMSSRHLLFVSPVYWLALNNACLKSTNQLRLNKMERGLSLEMPMKLVILSLLINMMSIDQADWFWDIAKKCHIVNFMVVYCFMMLLLVLFGQKIKSLLELVSWWPRNTLNNGNGTVLLLKFTTCIVTMGFSMMNSLWRPARTTSRLCHFLELVLIIRIPLLSSGFKLSCACHRPFWFMFHCTGAKGADNLDFGVLQ